MSGYPYLIDLEALTLAVCLHEALERSLALDLKVHEVPVLEKKTTRSVSAPTLNLTSRPAGRAEKIPTRDMCWKPAGGEASGHAGKHQRLCTRFNVGGAVYGPATSQPSPPKTPSSRPPSLSRRFLPRRRSSHGDYQESRITWPLTFRLMCSAEVSPPSSPFTTGF